MATTAGGAAEVCGAGLPEFQINDEWFLAQVYPTHHRRDLWSPTTDLPGHLGRYLAALVSRASGQAPSGGSRWDPEALPAQLEALLGTQVGGGPGSGDSPKPRQNIQQLQACRGTDASVGLAGCAGQLPTPGSSVRPTPSPGWAHSRHPEYPACRTGGNSAIPMGHEALVQTSHWTLGGAR